MKVIVANHLGMCFGVRDAIQSAQQVEKPTEVTIHGELVHNRNVLADLKRRGFAMNPESVREEIPATPRVLVTAHGISEKERTRLLRAGKELIDTTCPLVHRVHEAARRLHVEGWFIVVIGKPNHVEVRGIVGDLERFAVVEKPHEALVYNAEKIGVVCQTTTPPSLAQEVLTAIRERNQGKEVKFVDTICHPTRERQEAALDVIRHVEALVVVGGRNSNNTRQLGLLAEARGVPWFHVETAANLDRAELSRFRIVGLTAGTSTPDPVIQGVHRALLSIQPEPARHSDRLARTSRDWLVHFQRKHQTPPPVPWNAPHRITDEEREAIERSIRIFQLGESGQGTHFIKAACDHAARLGDETYVEALKLFIAEEQGHSGMLGRFMDQQGISRAHHQWSNGMFRALRKLWNLEICIAVLVTAELIAKVYYRALRDATRSPALKAICRQILHDEVDHIYFQAGMLAKIRRDRPRWMQDVARVLHRILMSGTLVAVWLDHHRCFEAGGFHFERYWKQCHRELTDGLRIMRTAALPSSDARRGDVPYRETQPASV